MRFGLLALLELSDISSITAYILGGKTNLLTPCFDGWIIHVWGAIGSIGGGA